MAVEREKHIIGCKSIGELVENLERPRKIMLMIRAGEAVDHMIAQLVPVLEEGDIIIDGGNSYFKDTIRRTRELHRKRTLLYRNRRVRRRGGSPSWSLPDARRKSEAWEAVKPIFMPSARRWTAMFPAANGLATMEQVIL